MHFLRGVSLIVGGGGGGGGGRSFHSIIWVGAHHKIQALGLQLCDYLYCM